MDDWPMGVYEASGANPTGITEVIHLPTASGPMPIATDVLGATQSLYAVHTDHLNTPRRLASPQGDAVWQRVITDFGEMHATTAANGFVPTGESSWPTRPRRWPLVPCSWQLQWRLVRPGCPGALFSN